MQKNHQRNTEIVNRFYEAIARGDLATARKVLRSDLEWVASEPTGLWFGGTYQSACVVLNEVILPAYRWIDGFRMEMERLLAQDDYVVAIGRFRGKMKTTGIELNAATTHVWTLRHGKAIRVHTYHSSARGSEVLGAKEQEIEKVAA